MKIKNISVQKAVGILRKTYDSEKENPIGKAMLEVALSHLRAGHEVMTKKGSKVVRVGANYFLFGYAEDGSDLNI